MKFRVHLKDPDCLHDAITEPVRREVQALGLEAEEAEAVIELRREKVQSACSKWFEYGEYLTVEIDTDAGTAVVVERKG